MVLIAIFLWRHNALTHSRWLQTSAFGVFLGLGAIESICWGKSFFSIFIAGYVLYFIYLKQTSEISIKTKCTMLSLMSGVVVGFSGLIQWCYYCT